MGKLKPRAGGKALTGGYVKFSYEFIKNLPGMDGKWDSGPKGSKSWKKGFNKKRWNKHLRKKRKWG